VAILFTALLGLGRAFVPEREQRTMDGLVLAPCDRSAIWLAKSLATLAFLAAAEIVALPLYALFFHGIGGSVVLAVALADLGICAVGTFLGAMAVVTRARDLLLPLLFLPLALPVVIGAVGASVGHSPGKFLGFLAAATIRKTVGLSRIPLPALAAASFVLVTTALLFIFYVAPNDANQGFSQRIFYFHVSIAFTAYACFIAGAWQAFRHLWKRDPRSDLQSYVCVHQGLIFGAMVLISGSIWAKISWGRWWVWSEDELVLFLVLYLFYCAYFMLRFSVDPGPQRSNLSAVYALFGVILIPVSFAAIRLGKEFLHPRLFTRNGPNFGGWILVTYCIAQAAMLVLAYTLYRVELAGKRLDLRLRELKEVLA
jgi:heme exporter protein C